MTANTGVIRAVGRAFHVLQTINRLPNPTIMQIKTAAGLPYPTVYRIIQTLVHEGLIESEPARKRYRPTELVLSLTSGFQPDDRLVGLARPLMVELTRAIGWPVTLAVRVGGRIMLKDSTHALTTQTFANYYPGYTLPLQDCASGKAYLAFCTGEERRMIQQNASVGNDDEATTGLARLHASNDTLLAQIREDGYATHARNLHSDTPGKTSSIAVPLVSGDRLLGCLTIIFFAAAMSMQDAVARYLHQLTRCADAIGEAHLDARNSQGG